MPFYAASVDDDDSVVDVANTYAESNRFLHHAVTGSSVDHPGGNIDDPGGFTSGLFSVLLFPPRLLQSLPRRLSPLL